MRAKPLLIVSALIFSVFTSMTVMASTENVMATMINEAYPNAIVSALFIDANNGKTLFSYRPHKMLSPASNIKVFLAVAAWYELGSSFQFKTKLLRQGKTLYVKFSGDPSLTRQDLESLVNSVTFRPSKVVIDDSAYLPPYHPAGITYDDLGWYYEAPSTAVIIDGNAVEFYLKSSSSIGGPVEATPKTEQVPIQLNNDLKIVSWATAKKDCDMYVDDLGNNQVHLYGCLAKRKNKKRINLAIPNPSLYAQAIIQQALAAKRFRGAIELGKTPRSAQTVAVHHSKKLPELLTFMLQESDNLYADSLTKRLGIKMKGKGSYVQGALAIKKALRKHTSVDVKQLKIRDGQGTRYNLITAAQMNQLLKTIWRNPRLKALMMKSLPTIGESGTLAERLKETKLSGRVKAKTGSMHDTSSLAGFILTPRQPPVIFSIIINHINGNVHNAKAFEDKLLLAFSTQDKQVS